jgi:hypothetical protein
MHLRQVHAEYRMQGRPSIEARRVCRAIAMTGRGQSTGRSGSGATQPPQHRLNPRVTFHDLA